MSGDRHGGIPSFNEMIEERRYRSKDGLELVADVAGPPSAPGVILLHGGGQTRHSWSGAMHALVDRGYRAVSFDARGHGDSGWSPTGDYDLDHRADDLRAVAAALDGPFAVVGASLGGATAMHAVAHGLDAAALILVDVVPEPEEAGVDRIVTFMRANPDGFADLDEASAAVAAYNPHRPRPRDMSGLMRNLRPRPNGRLYWHWDPRILESRSPTHRQLIKQSVTMLASRDDLPVLLVRGASSDVVGDAGIESFRAQLATLEVVDVSGAGHMVAGDSNDAFNTSVIKFLDRCVHERIVPQRSSGNVEARLS